MKKLLCGIICLCACVMLTACGGEGFDFKVGVILLGDETESYTKAHIDGINAAVEALELDSKQVIWKEVVPETDACSAAAEELVAEECDVIFSNSYGHQDYMATVAKKYPNVTFVACTGDYAGIANIPNYKNAFTDVYQSRYVSGVVAGLKLKELVEADKIKAENKTGDDIKIGYVGAYPYAEVVSGYTAFYLGIKSVVSNVVMDVKYTSSWFDLDGEAAAAEALVSSGCVIIGQHADSTGAPSKVQSLLNSGKVCYSVGYNVNMLSVAPTACLTSASNNWAAYYTYAIGQAMKGEEIPTNWAEGYASGAVAITPLGESCAEGTQEAVDTVIAGIKAGTLHVFDCSKFTVGGENIDTCMIDPSYMDFSTMTPIYAADKFDAIKTSGDVKYFEESVYRSAPYFSLRIDGITELD